MIESKLDELEALTLRMNSEELHELIFANEDMEFPDHEEEMGLCCELTHFLRDIPNKVVESLNDGSGFTANYNKVLPEGEVCVSLQGTTVWDQDKKKCVLGIEIEMASSEEHNRHD